MGVIAMLMCMRACLHGAEDHGRPLINYERMSILAEYNTVNGMWPHRTWSSMSPLCDEITVHTCIAGSTSSLAIL